MSATFILEYGGVPVNILNKANMASPEAEATPFESEASAWLAAHRAGLVAERCRVVNLYTRNQERTGGTPVPL